MKKIIPITRDELYKYTNSRHICTICGKEWGKHSDIYCEGPSQIDRVYSKTIEIPDIIQPIELIYKRKNGINLRP